MELRKGSLRWLASTPLKTPTLMRSKGISLSILTMATAQKYLFQKVSRAPLRIEQAPKVIMGPLICHLKPPAPKEEGREDFFR